MSNHESDPTLEALLDLDGQVLVVDPEGRHWVRFTVTRVPATPGKPHGLDYSLTLHGPNGERMVGFDNAHPASEVSHKTMSTNCAGRDHTSIATPQLCWQTSGQPSMRCCGREE